ncbi:MAG: type II toxin-antitoxin system YhaV family toxin [Waterburya sp.]
MKINGWNILFHPIFNEQWQNLRYSVKSLRSRLSQEDFVKHPQVKLFKAVTVGIEQKIPAEPLASYFALKKPLQKYSRMKKMGLPKRYRLFFKVFSQQQTIIILWLGFPRKEGDKKDCYQVFSKMIEQGQFPINLSELNREIQQN